MLTYNSFKNMILSVLREIKRNNYEKAKASLELIKQEIKNFLGSSLKILEEVEKHKLSDEVFNIIFCHFRELALDFDGIFSNIEFYEDGKIIKKPSKISLILKKLGRENDLIFFENVESIFIDILNFLEKNYDSPKLPSLSLKEIKAAVKNLRE